MKIKLAILENDRIYLERIVAAFNMRYAEKLEIYSFTNIEVAIDAIEQNKIDVLLADENFELDRNNIPKRCAIAYLVASAGIEMLRDEVAVCKFQKADLIYKQVLNLFSENSSDITGVCFDENENTKVLAFLSPSGGVGCSTAAAAFARYLAKNNKKVLFLNLEVFGSADAFFVGEGSSDLSDVIYAIKSKKGNMALKLESTVKQDSSGVYFYSSSKNALDMQELSVEETKRLVSELKLFGAYDYIVLDMDFSINNDTLELLKDVNRIVILSDGSVISNRKLEKAIEALSIIEQQSEYKIILKTGVLYNRVSSHSSNKPNIGEIKEFGGIKRYEGYTIEQMLKELSNLSVFDALV